MLGLESQDAELIRSALEKSHEWALVGRWDDASALLRGVLPLARERGPRDELGILLELLRVVNWSAAFRGKQPDPDRRDLMEQAGRLATELNDKSLRAQFLERQAIDLHFDYRAGRGQPERELDLCSEARRLYHEVGDNAGVSRATFWYGVAHHVTRGDSETALPYFEESYRIGLDAEELIGASLAARHIGQIKQQKQDWAGAKFFLEESLALREKARWRSGVAAACIALAHLRRERGDLTESLVLLKRATRICRDLGADFYLSHAIDDLERLCAISQGETYSPSERERFYDINWSYPLEDTSSTEGKVTANVGT